MADEVKNEETTTQEGEPKHTDEDVAKIIKARLKNVHEEKEALRQKLEAMQAMQSQGAPENTPGIAEGSAGGGPNLPTQNAPLADEGPLTQAQMQQLMQQQYEQQIKQQQEAQLQQIAVHHLNTMAKLKNDDNKFNELYENKASSIPDEVGMHLTSHLTPEVAKSVYQELMTNENVHLKMENAWLKAQQGNWGEYDKWLQSLLRQPPDSRGAPSPVPDLSQEGGEAKSTTNDNNLNSFIDNY